MQIQIENVEWNIFIQDFVFEKIDFEDPNTCVLDYEHESTQRILLHIIISVRIYKQLNNCKQSVHASVIRQAILRMRRGKWHF